jgi:hypothetical protein
MTKGERNRNIEFDEAGWNLETLWAKLAHKVEFFGATSGL